MKKVRVIYDQVELIRAAQYLAENNNIGFRNQSRTTQDWYNHILDNIKHSVKEDLDFFSTAGYTLNLEIGSFDSYHVNITVSPSFGEVILETMEVDIS